VARAESRPPTIAAANTTQPPPRAAPLPSPAGAAAAVTALTFVPAPAPAPSATAFAADSPAAAATATAPARADAALFHSLFQTGERREAIAPAVSELWGQPRTALPAPADAATEKATGSAPLALFRDPSN
jgi:hypothetical protein